LWLIILRMRRVSIKVSAVVTQSTLPTMIITIVSIPSPYALIQRAACQCRPNTEGTVTLAWFDYTGSKPGIEFVVVVLSSKPGKTSRSDAHGIMNFRA
jgi:hypothetical protein